MITQKKIWHYGLLVSLALVVLVGAFLRFKNITIQGFFRWDEAHYFFSAIYPKEIVLYGKPVHSLIIGAGILMFGLVDYAGKVMSGIFGLATVLILYRIGSSLYDKKTGLLAAVLLAVSYNHVYFSRLGHAQGDSVFFLALGVYFYTSFRLVGKAGLWRIVVSGMSLAAAFMCHPNTVTYVLFFSVLEVGIAGWKAYSDRNVASFVPAVALGSSMALTVLSVEVMLRLFIEESYLLSFSTYVGTALQGVFDDPFYYFKQISIWEGTPKLIISVLALIYFLFAVPFKRRSRRDTFILGLILFPILFWAIERSTADNDRVYTAMLIGFNLLVARFVFVLISLPERFSSLTDKYKKLLQGVVIIILASVCLVILGQNVRSSLQFVNSPSTYKIMSQQISSAIPYPVLMPDIANPIVRYYFLEDGKFVQSNSLEEAKPHYRSGKARFFLIPIYPDIPARKDDVYYQDLLNKSKQLQEGLSLNGKIKPVLRMGTPGSYDNYWLYDLRPVFESR